MGIIDAFLAVIMVMSIVVATVIIGGLPIKIGTMIDDYFFKVSGYQEYSQSGLIIGAIVGITFALTFVVWLYSLVAWKG